MEEHLQKYRNIKIIDLSQVVSQLRGSGVEARTLSCRVLGIVRVT
jgi:hypothetical protein